MGDIRGCGVDIIEIERIAKALCRKRFAQRIYTDQERTALKQKPVASWAVRFAAKEAVMKALGWGWQGGVGFDQIEILQDEMGKPYVVLHRKAEAVAASQGIDRVEISLSHSRELAIAYAVAVGEE